VLGARRRQDLRASGGGAGSSQLRDLRASGGECGVPTKDGGVQREAARRQTDGGLWWRRAMR
jgi:hypothetical protein